MDYADCSPRLKSSCAVNLIGFSLWFVLILIVDSLGSNLMGMFYYIPQFLRLLLGWAL